MAYLRNLLDTAAAGDPKGFRELVSKEMRIDANLLPGLILGSDLLPLSSNYLIDSWGRPFHLKFSRTSKRGDSDTFVYDLLIWSDGPNGRNEAGNGDDIHTTGFTITCPLPSENL